MRYPNRSSSSSRRIVGGMRLTTYDSAVTVKSGPQGCSETAAPPTTSRRSSAVTRAPRFASSPAATNPLCPPPITTTSSGSVGTERRLPRGAGPSVVDQRDDLAQSVPRDGELEHDAAGELDGQHAERRRYEPTLAPPGGAFAV